MSKLIEILKKETESLKEQYVQKTREWAAKYHAMLTDRATWNEVDWCNFMGLTPEMKNPGTSMQFLGFPKGFYNTRESREYSRLRNEIRTIGKMFVEDYQDKEEKKAIKHYEQSIQKLALRIEAKGLNQDQIKATTSHIGVNIDTTLTDGNKSVRAFTIIASGEIQKPHYRYLIK